MQVFHGGNDKKLSFLARSLGEIGLRVKYRWRLLCELKPFEQENTFRHMLNKSFSTAYKTFARGRQLEKGQEAFSEVGMDRVLQVYFRAAFRIYCFEQSYKEVLVSSRNLA